METTKAQSFWEQLTCPTCGSNGVEIIDGLLCCKYCKSKHTLEEKISEEEVIALNRATTDRSLLRFDEALEEYELLLKKYPDNEMANWGALLCDYGILYEEDYNGAYIPTCHRLNERPVKQSPYYAKLNAEHRENADEIEKLRLSINEKAKKIFPYDVFICYKQNEEKNGVPVPTRESKWARDIYEKLTNEYNLRVFFAEKSLAGSNVDYEPHIYSALRSAKLMFVLAGSIEHVNATWVANEWKRYAKYIRDGEEKTLRVVYDYINPYDLPKALQNTQAIDHNDMGWVEAVQKATEDIFEIKQETPEWQKAMEEMREKMQAMQANAQGINSFSMEGGTRDFQIKDGVLIKYEGHKEDVIIPNGVTKIGKGAFKSCNSLESIVIPDSVKRIVGGAFYECDSLKSVTIGNGVTSIGAEAFYNCYELTDVYITDIEAWCKISFGDSTANPLYYAPNLYLNNQLVTELVIPDSVTSIGDYAFYCYKSLKSVVIGNGVTTIGDYAFYTCKSLKSVTIGNGVATIGEFAFQYCEGLKSVTIGNGVTTIGRSAFYGCSSLTSIVIPDSVTRIIWGAFKGCNSLKIYACAQKKPDGWCEKRGGLFNLKVLEGWNPDKRPVVWGYKGK